ncbi:MAG: FAD-dependent oxidoreductase [Deltaproteobacteria bacterium]|nr:FAD-dependent oxidoreductase [Deltaproteobacteria bacterium]
MKYLILGGGPAGIAAAKTVRKAKSDAEILIVSEEKAAPYLRPLLPDFILGDANAENTLDPQGKDLQAQKIRIAHGRAAVRLDTGNRKAGFADGTEERYDRLLIATGGKPSVPAVLQMKNPMIQVFDSWKDSIAIKELAAKPGAAVVYGPGYLAIEGCRALRKAKKEVVWIQPDQPRVGYPIAGELEASILDEVRNRGARIKQGDEIIEVKEKGADALQVITRHGESITCSLVVVATERVPSVGFLAGSGLAIANGILVDEYLQTSVPDIYAAGDCAEFKDKKSGESRINFGWRSAIKQGQLAGENMAGGKKRFGGSQEDYFWALFGSSLEDRGKR